MGIFDTVKNITSTASDIKDTAKDTTNIVNEANDDIKIVNDRIAKTNGETDKGEHIYDNFALFTACNSKGLSHSFTTLKLRSSTFTADEMADIIRILLRELLKRDTSHVKSPKPDINLDVIDKINNPKNEPIPLCLKDADEDDSSSFPNISMPSFDIDLPSIDLPDINLPGLGDLISDDYLNKGSNAMGLFDDIADAINDFKDSVEEKLKEARNWFNGIKLSLMDKGDEALFTLLDDLNDFLIESNYIEVYAKWIKDAQCLRKHCKGFVASTLYDDDFLWYGKAHSTFILPINTSSGNIILGKFIRDMNTRERKECDRLQKRYNEYLTEKKKLALKTKKKDKPGGPFDMLCTITDFTTTSVPALLSPSRAVKNLKM